MLSGQVVLLDLSRIFKDAKLAESVEEKNIIELNVDKTTVLL